VFQDDDRRALFDVVRLLTILGEKRYKFEPRRAPLPSLPSLMLQRWPSVVAALLVITLQSALFFPSLEKHFLSEAFTEAARLVAALLFGAEATAGFGFANRIRTQSKAVHVGPVLPANREADVVRGAVLLKQIVPESTAQLITKRVNTCWENYEKLLNGDYLPEQVEEGTRKLIRCVCREIMRLIELNGGALPDSAQILNEYFYRYDCAALLHAKSSDR
jgi:hypothetical protein